jgi:branched-chain amino acid aminotransferase
MNDKPFPFSFFEGKIVPTEMARVNIMTNALQYGTGLFGGIRGYVSDNKKSINIFRIEDHYKRFTNALKIINKSIRYDVNKLIEITLEVARKNDPKTDCYFRPIAYASNLGISPDLSQANFEFALYMIPLGEYLSISKGLSLGISNWVRINDNMIPSRAKLCGGYINSALAKADAVQLGYDDALMLTHNGHIAEASAANFFMVRDGVLITSPKHADALEGITRRTVIELAQELKIPVAEREIDRTEVYVADEAFLSGTGVQVAWIGKVDGRIIGNGKMGPISGAIQKLFFNMVRGLEKKYSGYLTKI